MNSRRILVVDDERIVAEDIRECLIQMGCEVCDTAQSGPDAIEKAARHRPDLVLMDIVLQGEMDGIDAAGEIRRQHGTPCIFLTAYSDAGVLSRAKEIGPLGYVVKPFEESGLRSTVEVALHRIRMDSAVQDSHDWFATTLMSICDGVVAINASGAIAFMNPAAEKLTGRTSAEADGRPIDDVLPIIDDAAGPFTQNPALVALNTGETVQIRRRAELVRPDGKRIPIDDSAAPIRSRAGDLVGAVLVFQDATERRAAEEKNRLQKERLEELVEERTGEILEANRRLVAEIEERKRAESALHHRVEMQKALQTISNRFLRNKTEETEEALQFALAELGQFLEADAAYLIRFTENSAAVRVFSEWRSVAREPQDGDGDGDGNQTGLGALATWRDRLSPDSVLFAAAPDRESGREGRMEAIARARRAQSVLLLPLAENDELLGFLGVDSVRQFRAWSWEDGTLLRLAADIILTALRRRRAADENQALLQQLHQSQKMEAIGKLSGGIAHDFNNMLLPIIGYSDLLLQRLSQDDPMRSELQEIRRSAERAASLTRQMLAFSRKQVIKKTILDLNGQLENMERMLRRIIGEDIALRTELADDLPPVNADPGQLEQVVLNLVVNARDAMPYGGEIVLRTGVATACDRDIPLLGDRTAAGEYVVFSVSDRGCGMLPHLHDKIFEPFFTTKGNEGTGLGLSVVYGIVEQHHGGILVESEKDKGSTFTIFLPALKRRSEPAPAKPRDTAATRGCGERILLVEDEAAVIQFVSQALTQNGYCVIPATCYREALDAFEKENGNFDMIFSDAVLPDGNGVDLLDRFLTEKPDTRALLSSGYTDKDSLLELASERDISFLQKPYSLPQLFSTVREVIERDARPDLN